MLGEPNSFDLHFNAYFTKQYLEKKQNRKKKLWTDFLIKTAQMILANNNNVLYRYPSRISDELIKFWTKYDAQTIWVFFYMNIPIIWHSFLLWEFRMQSHSRLENFTLLSITSYYPGMVLLCQNLVGFKFFMKYVLTCLKYEICYFQNSIGANWTFFWSHWLKLILYVMPQIFIHPLGYIL